MDKRDAQTDYYHMLGVPPGASDEAIHHAYRQLAKRWHPDRFVNEAAPLRQRAEREMRRLTEAYATLGDPERRATYDAQHTHHAPPIGGTPFQSPGAPPTVPGFTPAPTLRAETMEPNGFTFFLGLIFLVITFSFLTRVRSGDFGALMATIGLLVSGALAVLCFADPGLIVRFLLGPQHRNAARYEHDTAAHRHAGTQHHPDPPGQPPTQNHSPHPQENVAEFDALVQQALADLPEEFAEQMKNVAIFVEVEPGHATLRRLGVKQGHTLFGLYEGVPLTHQGYRGTSEPERITLYQGPIERYSLFQPERIKNQIKATLLHEIAHHFGIDHDEMPDWVK